MLRPVVPLLGLLTAGLFVSLTKFVPVRPRDDRGVVVMPQLHRCERMPEMGMVEARYRSG